jgi:hypothetical protein
MMAELGESSMVIRRQNNSRYKFILIILSKLSPPLIAAREV